MTVFDCDATAWQGGTCVLPVLAAVEGKLGVLVTISWRLKLRPCSRLLAEGAAHRHRGFEWTGPTLWWSQGHNFTNCSQTHPTLLLTWTRWTHTHAHARTKSTHECHVQGVTVRVRVRDSHRRQWRKCRSMMLFVAKCFPLRRCPHPGSQKPDLSRWSAYEKCV